MLEITVPAQEVWDDEKEAVNLREINLREIKGWRFFHISVFLVFDRQPRACYPKRYPKS